MHSVIMLINFLVASFTFWPGVQSARILCIFPTPSISHQIVFRPLTRELAKRGHDLVIATTDPVNYNSQSIKEIDLSCLYRVWHDRINFVKLGSKKIDSFGAMTLFGEITNALNAKIFSIPEMKEILNGESGSFDLLIVEYLAYPGSYSLAGKLRIPFIGISSMDSLVIGHDSIGNFYHPLIYPDSHFNQNIHHTSFRDYFERLFFSIYIRYYYRFVLLTDQKQVVDKHVSSKAEDFWFYGAVPDLVLVNAHPVLGFARPVVPTFIDVTGIHMEKLKPLPEDIQKYLEGAENGAILFSLGTNVKSENIDERVLNTIIEVFAELPYRFIWKLTYNDSTLPKNIKTFSWLPQNDLLSHPKIKLFIFQGGYQSFVEAVTHAVPMIVVPFAGDQFLNADKIHNFEIGLRWHQNDLSKASVVKKDIVKVIEQKKFKNNVQRMSKQLLDSPDKPLERAVWWTEYVLRHNGTKHIQSRSLQASWVQILYLDILAILMFLVAVLFVGMYAILKISIRYLKIYN